MTNWLKEDLKYIWHPFTQMKDCQDTAPILITRAKGVKLYDDKGNFYYDTIASWWCNVHGHNHPKINQAIKNQVDKLEQVIFAGFTHKPAIQLAQELVKITPDNLTKLFFSDNGSTSVEVALKMSLQYWHNLGFKNKNKFISFDRAYHGDTIGAMSVSANSLFNQIFSSLLFPTFKVPSPYCYRCPVNKCQNTCQQECLNDLEQVLKEKNRVIAGLIVEPLIMAAGGMIIYPKACLEKIAKLAKQYNIHLIIDEVATGFGRTGKMFACDHTDIKPDFICLSKGLTAGYLPLAVTLTTKKVYQAFYADYSKGKTFYHGHTYTANPLACAASLASLQIFKTEQALKRVESLIPYFHQRLEVFRQYDLVGDVRYLGMMGAIELVKDKKTKQSFPWQERIGLKIYKLGLKEGLILRPLGNIIYFFLPLSINKKELKIILDKAEKIFKN